MESLRGKLLIAGPALLDPNFLRTVVLITEHTEDGAMGLVLNRPSTSTVADAIPDLDWLADPGAPLMVGGPVAPTGVIVLAEWNDPSHAVVLVEPDLGFVPGDLGDTDAVATAVRRARVFAGHAGWGPGQLEAELEEDDAWIVEPPRREEVFTEDPEGLWAAVLKRKGRRFALLSTMPLDPSLN
jgi:putative transcriptional regulator